ncbi:MAG: hypothetical protein J0M23_04980 [Rickettsiales bacterium]|nr:hypothetical protein [Rickettsiales bacterium]
MNDDLKQEFQNIKKLLRENSLEELMLSTLIRRGSNDDDIAEFQEEITQIVDLLQVNTSVKSIAYADNHNTRQTEITFDGMIEVLKFNTVIERFSVQGDSISSTQIKNLCKALVGNKKTSVKDLHLEYLRIADKTYAESIAQLIKENSSIVNLGLNGNALGEYIVDIIEALAENSTLGFINLSHNEIDSGVIEKSLTNFLDNSSEDIEKLQPRNISVEVINLSQNPISSPDALRSLSNFLQRHKSIKNIGLDLNIYESAGYKINTEDSLEEFINMVKKNPQLDSMYVSLYLEQYSDIENAPKWELYINAISQKIYQLMTLLIYRDYLTFEFELDSESEEAMSEIRQSLERPEYNEVFRLFLEHGDIPNEQDVQIEDKENLKEYTKNDRIWIINKIFNSFSVTLPEFMPFIYYDDNSIIKLLNILNHREGTKKIIQNKGALDTEVFKIIKNFFGQNEVFNDLSLVEYKESGEKRNNNDLSNEEPPSKKLRVDNVELVGLNSPDNSDIEMS